MLGLLRTSILIWAGVSFFWVELALNLIFYTILIGLVIGLFWVALTLATLTSPVWMPICLITAPLLLTVAIPVAFLIRSTRLKQTCTSFVEQIQSEPWKSKIWSRGILALITRATNSVYFRIFPARKPGQNSGYALLSTEGIIMGIFNQMSQRADIFQL